MRVWDFVEAGVSGGLESEVLADGAVLLRGLARANEDELKSAIESVAGAAAFRRMVTPGGHRMSAEMTNCGAFGWVSDRRGYRYAPADPETGLPWPAMPEAFLDLARRAAETAGYPGFVPDACLINRYAPGAKMALHQDRDETDLRSPIVSVSLGLPATFLFGGLQRSDRPKRVRVFHGDVAVWGGSSRLSFHGIAPVARGTHPVWGECRLNLTLRRAR